MRTRPLGYVFTPGPRHAIQIMGIFEMVRYPGDQTYRASPRGGPAIHDTPSDQDIGSEPEDKGAASLC